MSCAFCVWLLSVSPLLLWYDILVREHNMVDTTIFAAIMTKNDHDQQQTMPVCYIYVMGWRWCIFCVWLLSILPLLLRFSYFGPRTQHGRHDNICWTFAVIMTILGHDQQQAMPVCFLYVTGWRSCFFCFWLLSMLPSTLNITFFSRWCEQEWHLAAQNCHNKLLPQSWPKKAVIISKKGFSALYSHVLGCGACVFCVWLLRHLPLLCSLWGFWLWTHRFQHNNVCCNHDREWSWSAARNTCDLGIYTGKVGMCFCSVFIYLLLVLLFFLGWWLWKWWCDMTAFLLRSWPRMVTIESKQPLWPHDIYRGASHFFAVDCFVCCHCCCSLWVGGCGNWWRDTTTFSLWPWPRLVMIDRSDPGNLMV